MSGTIDRWILGVSAAFLLAQSAVMAADRMTVEHSKQSTGAESGLGYEYTFRVTRHGSGDPVDGAEFSVSTDMAIMPGAHHMPPVAGEPTGEPGTYKAELDFDMPGDWNLILRFRKPNRDQVVISDMIEKRSGGESHAGHSGSSSSVNHSGHDMKKE